MPPSETPAVLARIETRLESLDSRVGVIIKAVEGSNGTPGLKIRVDRIEQRWRLVWGAITLIGAITITQIRDLFAAMTNK